MFAAHGKFRAAIRTWLETYCKTCVRKWLLGVKSALQITTVLGDDKIVFEDVTSL